MIDRHYCLLMAGHNRWMNQRLYALCAELPDADRRADRGAFFKSVHGTMHHLLSGDRAWLNRFRGLPAEPLADDATFESLRAARDALDQEILEWAGSVDAAWLAADFSYRSWFSGAHTRPAWTLVVHLFNHQAHHRGQLTTLLSQLGLDPGVTDLPMLPELVNRAGA